MKHGPRNSLGEPWQEGQAWRCIACGESGPDRDDVRLSDCSALTTASKPHDVVFEPPEHAAAIEARHEARRA